MKNRRGKLIERDDAPLFRNHGRRGVIHGGNDLRWHVSFLSAEGSGQGEATAARGEADIRYAENVAKLPGWNDHGRRRFEILAQGVELNSLGGMSEVSGVKDHQFRGIVDAIADLNGGEIGSFRLIFLRRERARTGHTSPERPYERGTGQEAAAVHGDTGLGDR